MLKADLANLKCNVDKLDIDKLKNVPTNLNNWKSKVDKLDVDNLVPVPVDLNKLSDVVKNDVLKRDGYNAKIKNIEDKIPDITNLTTKTTFNDKTNEVKNEIASITNLATTNALNVKINDVKNKIPNITNLATTALTAVEKKIPNLSNLIKKVTITQKLVKVKKITTDHDHDKYIATQEFNKLTGRKFYCKINKSKFEKQRLYIANFVKKTDLNKYELNKLSKKDKGISTKVLIKDLFNKSVAKECSSGIFQNYLVVILATKYIKYFSGTTKIDSRKSNEMSEVNIKNITESDSNFAPYFVDHYALPDISLMFNKYISCILNP